jgi:PhoH-like ATPase
MPVQNPQENKQTGLRTNRIFILDTNVLIHDSNALFAFKGVVVGIPFIVLEELDTFKREGGEKGHNVRETIRHLDALRKKGHLANGVPLDHETDGSILKVYVTPPEITLPSLLSRSIHDVKDNVILQTVSDLAQGDNKVTLVTKDINVRIKADALGLEAEDYLKGTVVYDSFYKGWIRRPLSANDLREISTGDIKSIIQDTQLWPNQFLLLENENNPNDYRLFRHLRNQSFKEVEPITLMHIFGAKNIQQLMSLDLLMDDNVKLITLVGPAGTGKTFLALLVGLYKVAYERMYRKLLVTRPVVALGADIGYLPGDIQEKLHYWMQPVHDNLEFISSQMLRGTEEYLGFGRKKDKRGKRHEQERDEREEQRHHNMTRGETHIVDRLQQQGIISLEAITYMRGRSIPFQFVFIDEVQNLTPHEVKTIVSRAGEGTKVVLAGDPYQIDSPYLDFSSNGLTVTTEKMKEYSLFGTVFLETSERSELAKLAAEAL